MATTSTPSTRPDGAVVTAPDGHLTVDGMSFDALVDLYHKKIFNVLLGMMGDFHEAVDLTQEVFAKAWQALPNFRGDSKIYTWLHRIALNLGKNRLKQIASAASLMAMYHIDDLINVGDDLECDKPDITHIPERVFQQHELNRVVNEAIEGLPPNFRLVIILRDFEGLSRGDMSDILGVSVGAITSRLNRAHSLLRERLQSYLLQTWVA